MTATDDWLPTIGANRQIVLFELDHFTWIRDFLKSLNLGPDDCRVVHETELHEVLGQYVASNGLDRFAMTKDKWSEHFQIDRAIFGYPPKHAIDRVALLARDNGLLRSTQEMLVLWITWVTSQLHAVAQSDPGIGQQSVTG